MQSDTISRTTLRLDPTLHKEMRRLALERDTTFQALLDQAIRAFVEKERQKGGRR